MQEEIKKHKQNLIDRTRIFKTNNKNTNDLFAHLSPEDRQVMDLYRDTSKLAVKTKDDYCNQISKIKRIHYGQHYTELDFLSVIVLPAKVIQ